MRIKGLLDEDFLNYKSPSMYICTSVCDFKCDKESGMSCCQNSYLASEKPVNISDETLIKRYMANPITKAIVFAGLEPFDQYDEVLSFLEKLRNVYRCSDTVVIYTGYTEEEIGERVQSLMAFGNIIVKFGRFVPNQDRRFDDVLGVYLASPNQYAKTIS